MLAFSSRKQKKGGGSVAQPLAYVDPTVLPPNAPAGSDRLVQNGLILRPRIGGGSVQQPLQYLDTTYPSPSAAAGSDRLVQNGLIVRPVIPTQSGGSTGGFLPSVMKGVVNSGAIIAPLAAMAAKRMWNGTRKRRGGGKKEDWARNREAARTELLKYGKPSALNVNKFAALKRTDEDEADAWLTDYIVKKRKTVKKKQPKKAAKNKTEKAKPAPKKKVKVLSPPANLGAKTTSLWKNLVDRAKKNLGKYGKPSGPNIMKLASLHKKGLDTNAFVKNFKTRKQYVSPTKSPRSTYKNNLQAARTHLKQFGNPTVANVSKFVSLKRKGQSTANVETAVKSRAKPVTQQAKPVEPSAVKKTARSPPPQSKASNWKNTYKKAKENLQSIREKPKASQIASLAALRRRGLSNAEFLSKYGTKE